MEKINKEELMKKLNLTEDELEKVAGGGEINCYMECYRDCYFTKEFSNIECVDRCASQCGYY